jgi:hypothetical protein
VTSEVRSPPAANLGDGDPDVMNTCEVFGYDELLAFQSRVTKLSTARLLSPKELADGVGCANPKVITSRDSQKKGK